VYYLIYDGDCSFCSSFAQRVQVWGAGLLQTLRLQERDRVARLAPDLDQQRLAASFHVVSLHGSLRSGPEAIPTLVRLCVPGGRILAWLLEHAPGSPALLRFLYKWISERRW